MALIHASCIDVQGAAVLLRGAPGSGKSDLALRLLDGGARLVADDQVEIAAVRGELIASAPEALHGLLEVRGIGILRLPESRITPRARVGFVVDLGPGAVVPRLPEDTTCTIEGVILPLLVLAALEASTPAKIRLFAAGVERISAVKRMPRSRRR
ncbi:MAG: aldolase [Alphaproteobacteria bacterium]|nr:aldolase [Alphaproteobacteria bacterium]